ncbi:hypothetical protein, partial [Mesorhizobium sp. M8A.F.Ca.ET.167.01.1.1]
LIHSMIAPGRSASMSASRGELRTEETFLVSYADLRGFIEALDNQGMEVDLACFPVQQWQKAAPGVDTEAEEAALAFIDCSP